MARLFRHRSSGHVPLKIVFATSSTISALHMTPLCLRYLLRIPAVSWCVVSLDALLARISAPHLAPSLAFAVICPPYSIPPSSAAHTYTLLPAMLVSFIYPVETQPPLAVLKRLLVVQPTTGTPLLLRNKGRQLTRFTLPTPLQKSCRVCPQHAFSSHACVLLARLLSTRTSSAITALHVV